jgi:hypothetical protein
MGLHGEASQWDGAAGQGLHLPAEAERQIVSKSESGFTNQELVVATRSIRTEIASSSVRGRDYAVFRVESRLRRRDQARKRLKSYNREDSAVSEE